MLKWTSKIIPYLWARQVKYPTTLLDRTHFKVTKFNQNFDIYCYVIDKRRSMEDITGVMSTDSSQHVDESTDAAQSHITSANMTVESESTNSSESSSVVISSDNMTACSDYSNTEDMHADKHIEEKMHTDKNIEENSGGDMQTDKHIEENVPQGLSHCTVQDQVHCTEYSSTGSEDHLRDCHVNPSDTTTNTRVKPDLVAHSGSTFQSSAGHYIKTCKWSPDGSRLLACNETHGVMLYNPEDLSCATEDNPALLNACLTVKVGEMVYDMDWYPYMADSEPVTCCFLTTSRSQPIHLWDSKSGNLRCSYRAYDHLDELSTAYCVKFGADGQKIYCGYNQLIRVFDVLVPGRDSISRSTHKGIGQRGIISCIAVSQAQNSIYAAGSYNKSVGVYSERDGEMVCLLEGHRGGVTHLMFSPGGSKLFSGARMDGDILCWDMRNTASILYSLQRNVQTNQRIYFDISRSGRYLLSGNHDGTVTVWDLLSSDRLREDRDSGEMILDSFFSFKAHDDTLNSISMHPTRNELVSGSGQRHYVMKCVSDSDDSDCSDDDLKYDNSIKIWNMDDIIDH